MEFKEIIMVAENRIKNSNYIRIVSVLKNLLKNQIITDKEYDSAKRYYRSLTGADIIIAD